RRRSETQDHPELLQRHRGLLVSATSAAAGQEDKGCDPEPGSPLHRWTFFATTARTRRWRRTRCARRRAFGLRFGRGGAGMGGKKWATRFALAAAFAYAAAKVAGRWRKADLRGEVAVIVGGSRGLGLMIARELAAAGCRLVIGARDVDQLRVAQRDLEARGAEVLIWQCDVGNRRDIDLLVAEAGERFGRIDILVNVAGLIQVGPAESMTIDNFHDAFAVNFWGPLHAMDAVIAQMQERGH